MIKLKTPNSMEIAGQPAVITFVATSLTVANSWLVGYCDFVSDSSIQGLQKEGNFPMREYL